jgi:predicted NAD-dependent protein-ADP-ribosyltransferase YbiA (DUF1768 family)/adenylate kinase family enzyme
MPIFDNEINDKDVELSNLQLPDVDLRSPKLTTINPNLGNEPIGFGDPTPTFNGVTWGDMFNIKSQTGFDQPFSTVSGKTLLENQRYPLYERNVDLENINALMQPWYKQIGNGLVKGGIGLIGGFTESMMTIPDTIDAARSGDISKLYGGNEGIEKDIDDWRKRMEDTFPNYVSKYEREHPFKSVFGSGFANFLGDGLIKNIGTIGGYVTGAIAQDAIVGFATEGIGDIPLLASQGVKVSNAVGKTALWLNKILTGTNDVEKFLARLEKVTVLGAEEVSAIKGMGELAAATRINKGFRYALAQYGTARTMGAIDARETYEQVHGKLLEDYRLKHNGQDPVGQDLADIENYSKDGANTRFGIDFALMLLADSMQFDNLFRSFGSKGSAAITNSLAQEAQLGGKIGLKAGTLDTWESLGATTAKGKLWESISPKLPNIFAQGVLTMGGLYASGKGVENYYVNKYKDLSDPNNKKNFDTVNEIINSTMYGLGEQFGTTEGQKAMLMGSILGLVTAAIHGGVDRARGFSGNQRLQDSIDTLNKTGVTSILENKYDSALNTMGNLKGMEEAVKEGNVFKYKNFQYNNFFELVHSRLQSNMHEFTIEQLKMLKELPKEEFEKYFNVEFSETSKKTVNEYVDKMIEHANELKKTYDAVAGTFKNPFVYYRKDDTEAKQESNRGYVNFEKWKTELTYQSGKSIDVNDRIQSIQKDLFNIHPDLNNNGVAGLVNPIALKSLAKSYEERAKLLNSTINDDMTAEQKQAVKDQVKSLRTFAEKITSSIESENLDTRTFHELLNYELNGNDRSKPDVVGFEHAANLYQYGHDLNMLANEKLKAQEAVKALTSKDGFAKFFEQTENMNKDTTFSSDDFEPGKGGGLGDGSTPPPTGEGGTPTEPTEPTGPTTPKFTNKEGNVESFEVGRQYSTDKFNEPKITKIDEDRWQVSVPGGATTFHASEDKAKAKVNEIKQDYADLATVKILGFNDDGSIKVEDVNGDIQNIPAEAFGGYEKVQSRQEQLIKYAAEVGRIQDEIEKNSGDIATNSDEADIQTMFQESSFEDKKKDAPILFLSTKTESEDWSDPSKSAPHIVRSREFFNDAANLPNRADLQTILVHYGNEAALGLDGLTKLSYGENFDETAVTNLQSGFLAQVYVTKDGYYIDKVGNKIGKVGEPIDVNQVVFQTMPATKLTGIDSKGKEYNLHRNNQVAEAEVSQKQYIALREKIFADKSGNPIYSDFNISEGIGIELEDGKQRNNVTETLLPPDTKTAEKLINTHKGLITISKDGKVQFKGKSVKIPKGRPVFKYGDTLVPLNNGKLTPDRVDAIFEIFKKVSDNMKTFSKVAPELEFLQNVVFYKRGGTNRTANQVSIDEKTMTLGIGDSNFDITDVANNEKAIKEKLSNLYTNINSASLEKNFNNKFREFYMKNGELVSNVWDNYQTYLLSSKYPNGSARPESDIPLKTSIAKRTAENPVNFKQRYSTIIPTNLPYKTEAPAPKVVVETPDEKQQAVTELEKQANGAIMGYVNKAVAEDRAGESKYADDNETLNTYTLPGNLGEVGFFLDKDGNVELADTEKVTDARNAIVNKLQAIANKKAQEAAAATPVPEVKPEEPKDEVDPNKFKGTAPKDDYKRVGVDTDQSQISDAELALFKRWHAKNVPGIPYEVLEHIVTTHDGEKAFGVFQDGVAKFYKMSPKGSEYHEVFHGVWNGFLPKDRQQAIIEEFRANEGTFTDRATGKQINYSDATDKQAEERIADDFAEFRKGKMAAKSLGQKILDFFKSIIEFFKAFGTKSSLKDQLFKDINTGKFKKATMPEWMKSGLSKEAYELSNRDIDNFEGTVVKYLDHIGFKKDGREIVARNVNKGEKILIVKRLLKEKFDNKAWTNPTNSDPLPADTFKSVNDFTMFVLLHEKAHEYILRESGESLNDYETRVNNEALKRLSAEFRQAPLYKQVEGITPKQTHEFVQDMTLRARNILFNENKESIYNPAKMTSDELFRQVEALYIQEGKREKMTDQAWGDLVQKTKESLRTILGLKFNEESVADINAEGANTKEYDRDAFSIGRNEASSAIKIALMLPITSNKSTLGALPERYLSSVEGYKILPYVQAFSTIMDKLSNTSDVDLAMQKLAELAKNDPNYVRAFKDAGGNPNDFTFTQESIQTPADWRYLVDFYQTFTKMRPEVVAQYTNGDEVYLGAANLYTAAKSMQRGWLQNIRNLAKEEGALIKFKSVDGVKTYSADPDVFKDTPIGTDLDKLNFLNKLGINITPDVFAKLSKEDQDTVADQAGKIYEYLKDTKELINITENTLNVKSRFTEIAEIMVKATNPLQDGVYTGIDGKTRQANSQNNALSLLANRFNESGSLEALKENRPELNDVFSTHSLTLQKGGMFFDKEGVKIPKQELKVALINGDLDEVKDRGKAVTKLSLGKRFSTEINQNVNGLFYALNPADGASEYEVNLGIHVPFKDVQGGIMSDVHKIFKGYLLDDVALALDFKERQKLANVGKKAKELRFFKDILSKDNLKAIDDMIAEGKDYGAIETYIKDNISKINTDIEKYLENSAELLKNALMKNQQITLAPTKKESSDPSFYRFKGLLNEFAKEAGINKFMLSEQDVTDLVKFIDTNKTIANIEFHKILFGDPYQFKIKTEGKKTIFDETKRVKSFDSPASTSFNSDAFNNWHNVEYNKTGLFGQEGRITLDAPSEDKPSGDPGYDLFKDYLSTVTVNDMTIFGKVMGKTTENDAASILMDKAYRQVKLKNSDWGNDAEANFQWNMAYTRRAFDKMEGVWKYGDNEALKAHDDALLATPEPKFIREIIKPIVRGNRYGSDKISLVLDKDSQMPLYYKDVQKTVLADLYVKMWKENQDYIIAESGRKLGIEGVHQLYVGGKFNTEPFADNTIVKVPWSIYGIQVENNYDAKGGKVTSSVQVPKIINLDLFANGKPVTTDPKRAKVIQDEYDRGVRIKNALNENGYMSLLTKLGMDEDFNVINRKALAESLNNEILRVSVSENIKDAVKLDDNGEFIIPFEASFAYKKIKDVIYSMLDKSINHAKTNGGAYVQAPVTMWENAAEGRRIAIKTDKGYKELSRAEYDKLPEEAKGKVVLTDDTLHFPTVEDPYMEIMIPHWFSEKIKNNKRFDTDEKVLTYLNTTPEGQEILRGVAFRIPCTGHNTIDSIRVKKLLPQSMGKTVVVPSEITTKAGSDFDVDKLTTYLKNVYIDKNNDLKPVKYQESEEATREFFAKTWDEIVDTKKFKKAELLEAAQILSYDLEDPKGLVERYANILDQFNPETLSQLENDVMTSLEKLGDADAMSKLKNEYINDHYRAALENEYYDHLEKMINLPEVYEQRMTPVDDAGLSKFADKIDDLENNQDETIKNRMINGTYLTEQRHAFVMAKDWVGIVASNIAAHSVAQKGNIILDPIRFDNIDPADLKYLGDGVINIPHNTVTIDGVKYATLSGVKTADESTNISTRLGGHGTAVVDVAKDPYILKIINSNLAPTIVMFLERIGAGETGLMFIKQPIIKDFLTRLDNRGATSIYSQSDIDDAFSRFQTTENGLLSADTLNVDKLEENIRKYNREGLTATENAEQHLILREFLKYAKMADYMSDINQALTYDTAKFGNGEALSKKQYRTQRALENNIFGGVQELLDNTFLGTQARFLDDGVNAIGEVLKLEGRDYTNITNQVLAPYMKNKYLRADDFNAIGNKIKMSFLDYIIQVKGDINDSIKPLIADAETSIASQLTKAQAEYPEMEILKVLESTPTVREGGPRSITSKINLRNDAATEDILIGYMRELRDNPGTNELYNNLVKVAILQGMYKSPISIGNIIPIEDYSKSITPIVEALRVDNELKAYTQGWFQRNNFRDSSIFTKIEPKFRVGEWSGPSWDPDSVPVSYYSTQYFPTIETYNIASTDRKILTLNEKYNYLGTRSNYVQFARGLEVTRAGKPTGEIIDVRTGKPFSKNQIRLMKEKGDTSFKDLYNYQRVTNADGSPFYIYDNGDKLHVYKLINVYGDGNLVHEYYDDFRPSPFNNGTVKVKEELTDDQVRNALSFKADTSSKAVTTVPTKVISEGIKAKSIEVTKEDIEKRPEFSKLPYASVDPTMTYAGIGSRQTPPEALAQMTELAKELDARGYTLRSGGAEGADTAFESGATKKEIFKGFDQAGEIEKKIAHEIHPNLKGAMESSQKRATAAGKNGERSAWAVENLMARNTNQIFGKNLDTPSDFVVFYAKETNGIRPEGGTGQAVEMARLKGIPTINLANPNWRAELDKVLGSKTKPVIDSSKKINIYAGTGENAELSNFANRPFENGDGVKFNTVEGAFQAAKLYSSSFYFFPDFGGPRDSFFEMQEKFQNATGAEARALGQQVKGLDRTKWDSESSRVMKDLLKASFEQNPEALKALLATGNAELTHTQESPKSKWRTEFPKLLMEVRSELSKAQPVQTQPVENYPIEKAQPTRTILEARQTPIDYTPGQTKALQQVGALIDANKQGYYLLAGYAGTGKTTIAENIANYARENDRKVHILAPTNKAAKVLNDKLFAAGVSAKAETIHRAIYGEPDPDTGDWIPKTNLKNSVILVDESSMIAKDVMADLLANSKNNNIVVFMGDSFQLEPVGDDSKLFAGGVPEVANSQSQLTEVKRQSLDSNILKVATLVRTDNKGYVPEQSMDDFKISKSKGEFIKEFREAIKNNENAVGIVATNQERLIMNDAARLEKFGADRKILNNGETLIAVANSSDVPNSEIFKAAEVEGEPVKHVLTFEFNGKPTSYNMYFADVVGENGKRMKVMHFPGLDRPSLYHSQVLTAVRNSAPQLFNELRGEGHIKINKKGNAKLSGDIVISTYGYAVTAHKSQGSQWDKVFVNQNYNAPTWNAARWYYTAITRSAKDVVVLPSINNVRIKNADIESKINSIVTDENDITSQIENEKGLNTKDFKC